MTRFHYPLLFLCGYLSALCSNAQLTQRNLLKKYAPEVVAQALIPKDKWHPFPQTPAEWKEKVSDSVIQQLVRDGEEALSKEFRPIPASIALDYVRNGNRSRYEAISFSKRKQLWDLMMAETVEGKGRFLNALIDGIWSVCEESFWGSTAHLTGQKGGSGLPNAAEPVVDLFAAETASALAWTDYFLGPALAKVSNQVRPRIAFEIKRRILDPMLTANYSYLGVGRPEAKLNNWAPWVISNYITAALLIEKDESKRADALVRSMKVLDQYINGLGEDGSCDEGPSYWFVAGASVFDALNLLEDASGGKINIYNEPIIQKMGTYVYKTHIVNENFINVADAPAKFKADGLMLYRFGQAIGDETMKRFGSWAFRMFANDKNTSGSGSPSAWNCMRKLYNLQVAGDAKKYIAQQPMVKDVWLSDIELMAARGNRFYVATHGGHNAESHNHNDVGDFIVYADNYPLIIDVGRGTYTSKTFSKDRYTLWFNTSSFHNLPTINGYQQKEGKDFKATAVAYKKAKDNASLSLNIASAYPPEAGVKSWQRMVQLGHNNDGILITDAYDVNATSLSTQTFMTTCEVTLVAPGKIGLQLPSNKTVNLSYDPQLWEAKKEKVPLTTPEDQVFKTTWEGKDIWRILLTSKKALTKGTTRYTFSF
jgi:hypothetical protein